MSQRESAGASSDPIHSVVQKLADSIASSVDSKDWSDINEQTRLLVALIDAVERYDIRGHHDRRPAVDAELERVHADMNEMHTSMDEMGKRLEGFLKRGNFWARMVPLFLVAVAVVAYPLYGMITHMDPQSLVQYLAPISGLAGAIIGYWFGRQGDGT